MDVETEAEVGGAVMKEPAGGPVPDSPLELFPLPALTKLTWQARADFGSAL